MILNNKLIGMKDKCFLKEVQNMKKEKWKKTKKMENVRILKQFEWVLSEKCQKQNFKEMSENFLFLNRTCSNLFFVRF